MHDGEHWPAELRALGAEYEITGELGRGSSAVVYLARDRALDRDVAIKLVRAPRGDDDLLERSAQEARLLARLPHHPNIVAIYAVRRLAARSLALVMQYVPGETLRARLAREGRLPVERAALVLRDLARALHFAHGHGVVHRDVKPENVYLDADTGRALLSDFGSATLLHVDARRTAVGAVIGTPAYMSPEQIEGTRVDGRSDLYSLGLVGWEMLTGLFPWGSASLYEILYRQRHADVPPVDEVRPDLPTPLVNAVEGALERDPARRWPDAAAFLAALLAPPDVPRLPRRALRDPVPTTLPTTAVDDLHARTLQVPRADDGRADARAAMPAAEAPLAKDPLAKDPLAKDPLAKDPLAKDPLVEDAAPVATPLVAPDADARPAPLPAPAAGVPMLPDEATVRLPLADARTLAERDAAWRRERGDAASRRERWRRRALAAGAGALVVAVVGLGVAAREDGRGAVGEAGAREVAGEVTMERGLEKDLAAAASTVPADSAGAMASRDTAAPDAAAPAPPPTAAPTVPIGARAPRLSRGAIAARCARPTLADQRTCLLARLADYDAELNRVYMELIYQMRVDAGGSRTGPDPASVRRLRQEQRAWLVERDVECQRRGRGREGALWAEDRARCLGALGRERAQVLRDRLVALRR